MTSVVQVLVWGIRTCDSVRKSERMLTEQGVVFERRDLRATPPERARIAQWMSVWGAKKMKNTSGGSYRALPADKDSWSDSQWLDAFAADPMLLKRPIIEVNGVAAVVGLDVDQLHTLR
jgi:arsenate reductase (glutaredoxin)